MDADAVASSAGRLLEGRFTFDDFLAQLQQVRKLGSLGGVMKLLPGMSKEMRQAADQIDDREIGRVEAIVRSMTPAERADPTLIDGSRRARIARGSGSSTGDVNQLLKQFKEMQKMMKGFGGGAMAQAGGLGKLGGMLGGRRGAMAGLSPASMPGADSSLSELLASAPSGPGAGAFPGLGAPAVSHGGTKGAKGSGKKKKKGGRVTPPKPR
jgi:signal recognition particle subunit SRP54